MEEPTPSFSDASTGDPGCLTYETHFGLREKPFSLSPNPRFFVRSTSHAPAFDALIAGIRRREGILTLTGEVGTGKTTLCRAVLEALDRKTFAAFVPNPIVSREELLKTVLVDFGVVSIDDVMGDRLRGAGRTELSYALYEFLTSLQPLRAFAVLMIDEAQNLPAALLEEIRILSDLEHDGERLLQLVLIGQPELNARLGTPEMRQLKQRITVRCELQPLAAADVGPYISQRLGVAGNGKLAVDGDAIQLTYAASEGIPRVINLLCDRALGKAASAEATRIRAEHVVGAAEELWIPVPGVAIDSVAAPHAASPPAAVPEGLGSESSVRRATARNRGTRQGLPSTYQMRHDAHYVEELQSRRESRLPESPAARPPMQERTVAPAAPQRRSLKLAGVAVTALVLGAVGTWLYRSSSSEIVESPSVAMTRESTGTSAQLPASAESASARGIETSGVETTPSTTVTRSTAEAPRFAVQMATFRSGSQATESVRQLGAAGYEAFKTEVLLRDGDRAFAVFLGPYGDRRDAERDLERARSLPGYGNVWVVQLGSEGTPTRF